MLDIVFLSPHSDPQAKLGEPDSGGQCVYEHQLALNLSKYGNTNVTTFCRLKYDYDEESIINQNYKIVRITCGPGREFVPKEEMETCLNEFTDKVIEKLDLSHEIVLYGHYWDGGAAALMIKDKLPNKKISIIWTPHSLGIAKRRNFPGEENEAKFKFIPRIAWENYILMVSDKIIVSTENEKLQLITDYMADEKKIGIINPGVSAENMEVISKVQARKDLKLPANKNIVMTLGRLDRRKGYHNAINAFAKLNKRKYRNTVLAIFSGSKKSLSNEEKEYLKELKSLARKNRVSNRVIFKRAVDYSEVNKVFCASDLYLCLSENEPFGLTVIESMSFNVPVIATNQGGPSSIITDKANGYLVDSKDSEEVSKIIETLLNSDFIKGNVIRNANTLVKRIYSWKAKVKQFDKTFSSLVKKSYKPKKLFKIPMGIYPKIKLLKKKKFKIIQEPKDMINLEEIEEKINLH